MLRKFIWWVLVFSLVVSSCASGKYSFQVGEKSIDLRAYVPAKYLEGVRESLDQAGENASELVKVLTRLYDDYEKRLKLFPIGALPPPYDEKQDWAAFLIATMPWPDLISIKADYLLEHLYYTYLIKHKYPWLKKVPDDIFLAYVLPYRVSEEPITPHRKYFYQQLDPLVKDCQTMLEVAYQVNLWLGGKQASGKQRVGFKPAEARDKSPFATLYAGHGRCEEMMIVYISAVRAVGIPARSVWTPWWANFDNNHAWTEVWADLSQTGTGRGGKWYSLGSCEVSINLAMGQNTGWFVKKGTIAATIYSPRLGEPEDKSTIYKSDGKSSIVNVLTNYSQTCQVNVTVLSPDGKTMSDMPVLLSVVNFGGLRGFALKKTNQAGKASFTTGIGDYFLSAGKVARDDPEETPQTRLRRDNLSAWKVISTKPNETINFTLKLAEDNYPEGYFCLRYPDLKTACRAFNPGENKEVGEPSERLKKLNAEHSPSAPPETYYYEEFLPEVHPEVSGFIKETRYYNDLVKILKSSGGNWPEIARAIQSVEPNQQEDLLWLVSRLSLLDSLEVTSEILLEHVKYAHLARTHLKVKIPEDIFRPYVLSYDLLYTHAYPWRKRCYEVFSPMIKDDIFSTAQAINEWIEKNIKIVDIKTGRYFCFPNPAEVFTSRRATKLSLTIATIAGLRSVGIPARRKATWVEFFDGNEWLPLYPTNSKDLGNTVVDEESKRHYVKCGGIRVITQKAGVSFRSDDSNYGVARFVDGGWQLMRHEDIGFANGWMNVPPGDYLVNATARNSNGDALLYLQKVHLESDKGVIIKVPLDLPLEMKSPKEQVVRELTPVPDFTLKDRDNKEYHLKDALKQSNILLVFFTLETEPSIRTLPRIQATRARAKEANVEIWTILTDRPVGVTGVDDARLKDFILPILLDKEQTVVKRFLPEFETEKNEILPSVVLINQDHQIVLHWERGYNLVGIDQVLEDTYVMLSGKTPQEITLKELTQQVKTEEITSLAGLEYAQKALGYLQSGAYQKAITAYKKALEDFSDVADIWYNLACAYSRNGNIEEGLEALKQAVALGYCDFKWIKEDQDLENLRQDKRFEEIVR